MADRQRLSNRRNAITVPITWAVPGGHDFKILVSFGFDGLPGSGGKIKEAFVASFRANSGIVALVNDACILYSRLLQHGDSLEDIAATMVENRNEGDAEGPPASMMGAVARTAVLLQAAYDGSIELPHGPRLTFQDKLRKAVAEALQEELRGSL